MACPRSRMRCVAIGLLVSMVMLCGVYVSMFMKPPTEEILAANRKGAHGLQPRDYYIYFDGAEPDPYKLQQAKWDLWVRLNSFVEIGEVYLDTCENPDTRYTIGKVVLLQDQKLGGLKTRTYANFTLDRDVTDGELFIDIYYNGKQLYNNHFPLCTSEDRVPEKKILKCPIQTGKKRYEKDMKIPNFLPKGTYTTKTWITDQDERIIGCGFCEFKI